MNRFLFGVDSFNKIPPNFTHSEIALIGRSNVGKSSLINAIYNNKKMARVSKRPGSTRQLNFFSFQKNKILVDLPGYGYPIVQDDLSRAAVDYLTQRSQLKKIFLLLDSRHLITKIDSQILNFLFTTQKAISLVLTKIDKLNERELQIQVDSMKRELALYKNIDQDFFLVSSTSSSGINQLVKAINAV